MMLRIEVLRSIPLLVVVAVSVRDCVVGSLVVTEGVYDVSTLRVWVGTVDRGVDVALLNMRPYLREPGVHDRHRDLRNEVGTYLGFEYARRSDRRYMNVDTERNKAEAHMIAT